MLSEILFLHPPRNLLNAGFFSIPVGVFGIVNNLRSSGYEVTGYNLSVEMMIHGDSNLKNILEKHRPKVVLIDLHWYEHSCGAIEVSNYIKSSISNCIVIIGGLTATIFAKEIVRDYPAVDFVVRGEAESVTKQLVDAIVTGSIPLLEIKGLTFRNNETIVETPLPEGKVAGVDEYDYVDFSWLCNADAYLHATPAGLNSPYTNFWLMMGLGCPFSCLYCGGSRDALGRSFGNKSLWRRSPENVAKDIKKLWCNSVQIVNPSLDLAILGKKFWGKLFKILRDSEVKIGIYNEVFQIPSKEFLADFASAVHLEHSTLVFSPLVGDERLRKLNGKMFSNEELLNRLEYCYKLGLRAELGFSENLPGCSKNSEQKQALLLKEIEKVYPGIVSYSQQITLDPQSAMALYPKENNIVTTFKHFADYVAYTSDYSGGEMKNGYLLVGQTSE